jgi:diamine N-acetyltransferase
MFAIEYRDLPPEEIDMIKPLWEKLNAHHHEKATVFKNDFENITFEKRKIQWTKKQLKIIVAQEFRTSKMIGYCVSSISEENGGEIDSIYIIEDFRKNGVGKEFIKRSLIWFEQKGITEIIISVVVGNEEALPFYEKFGFIPRSYILKKKQV